MTTIINTPGGSADDGMGALLGVILIIVLALLFIIFALPYLRGKDAPAQPAAGVTVTVPTGGSANNQ